MIFPIDTLDLLALICTSKSSYGITFDFINETQMRPLARGKSLLNKCTRSKDFFLIFVSL